MRMQTAATLVALSLLISYQVEAYASPAPIGSALTDESAVPSAMEKGARIVADEANDNGFYILAQNEKAPQIHPEARAMQNAVKSAQEAEAIKSGESTAETIVPDPSEIEATDNMLQIKPSEETQEVTPDMLKKSDTPHGAPVKDDDSISATDLPDDIKAKKPNAPVESAEEAPESDDMVNEVKDESEKLIDTKSPKAESLDPNNSDDEMPIIPKKDHKPKPVQMPDMGMKNVAPVVNANESTESTELKQETKVEIGAIKPDEPIQEVQLTKNLVDQIPVSHYKPKQMKVATRKHRRHRSLNRQHKKNHHVKHVASHKRRHSGVRVIPHKRTHKENIGKLIQQEQLHA